MPTRKIKNYLKFLLIFLFFANLLAWLAVYELARAQFLEIVFFDIGQGDAIFIETPQHHQILIDGGPTSDILEKLAGEMPFWDRTIDLIILTHPEKDHLAGLIEVLKSYKVENIVWTGVAAESFLYKEWLKRLELEGTDIHIAKVGQKIRASKVLMEVLHPLEDLENQKIKYLNNTSIVVRLSFFQDTFLFTGDIFKSGEKKIIGQGISLNSDILKLGHHGSRTSTSEEFLKAVTPEIAVISVGKNSYGHPHQEVLERLEAAGAKVLRTDREGDITVISNGFKSKIKYQKSK